MLALRSLTIVGLLIAGVEAVCCTLNWIRPDNSFAGLSDTTEERNQAAREMPPTSCQSVEPVPRQPEHFAAAHQLHDLTVGLFENASGFGFWRMRVGKNQRGVEVASPVIDRVELVSLLTEHGPSVYVLDEMATPKLIQRARRRPLDDFERRGLEVLQRGEELVWTREAPTRMFGAIRARTDCLECHRKVKVGELIGAFTYYLDTSVEMLDKKGIKFPATQSMKTISESEFMRYLESNENP